MSDSMSKTIVLDNGSPMTFNIGDIIRHVSWDSLDEKDKYLNKHLYRVTGFSTLPKDNSEVITAKQIYHPMREYMFKVSQLQSKVDRSKYPDAKQEYLFIKHDVQFTTFAEVTILEQVSKDMISYIRFQEDPTRSELFKSYYKK